MVDGSCEFFSAKPFLDAADILVAADEPLRALDLLKNLPAYYRDKVPEEIQTKINRIYARLATPAFYSQNIHDHNVMSPPRSSATMDAILRGQLILKDVQDNQDGTWPHIFDLGPGEYWLPIALKYKGLKFTYQDVGLNPEAKRRAEEYLKFGGENPRHPKAPVIFVACELIEHLHHEEDLRVEYERNSVHADIIHISTPKYTWDGRQERLNWDREGGDLGHLRTYTPGEFVLKVTKLFPEFDWQFFDAKVMHLRGTRRHG